LQDKEIWKPIKGYEGYYEVSNLGEVKSLSRKREGNGKKGIIKERVLKNTKNGDGYLCVKFYKKGTKTTHKVHRLVAETFIKKVKGKSFINHKDGNKLNNDMENLEWCTFSENIRHAYDTGLNPVILNLDKQNLNLLYNYRKLTIKDIAKKLDCSERTIRRYIKKYNLKENTENEQIYCNRKSC
jgi:hypothetical protein